MEYWAMTELANLKRTVKTDPLFGEGAFSFLKAVLGISGEIIAFLDAEKKPILLGQTISTDEVSLTNAEMCPVNDSSGNLLGYILRRKSPRGEYLDYLTGTLSRAQLEREFARRSRSGPSNSGLTLIFIDLDRFKPINEQFGHLVGDQVLLQFSVLLKNSFRADDCVARYGGDEFVILCDCPPLTAEKRVLEFQSCLSNRYIEISYRDNDTQTETVKGKISLDFSYGLTSVSSGDSLTAALRRADTKLLAMKKEREI